MEVTLAQLAQLVGGELEGPPERLVDGLKGIEEAGARDVAFLANPKYAKHLPQCQAGVVLVTRDQKTPEGMAVIRVDSPALAYAQVLTAAHAKPYEPLGVHERAVVDPSAKLGDEVSIHANAWVGPGAELGRRVVLHPGVYVGQGARIGDDTVVHPNVVIHHGCVIGRRCIIGAGCVIGSDGYSFVPDGQGHYKIPQVGIVQIDDDVELGALNTIDRAALERTWIQRGVKTDDLVHVGHNCVIGENTLLVAQVGISGSTKVGKNVVLGGKCGVAGHITIGDGVMAGAKAGLAQSVEAGQVVAGYPAMPQRLWLRTRGLIRRLPELFDRVKSLEKRLGSGGQEDN